MILQELGRDSSSAETSYTFETDLKINSVWSGDEDQLLEVFISGSKVDASGKARSITRIPDRPFYISLVRGQPDKVIAHTSKDQSLLNLERGIASLLQLRLDASQEEELDVSGLCRVSYNVKSSTKVEKPKGTVLCGISGSTITQKKLLELLSKPRRRSSTSSLQRAHSCMQSLRRITASI